jgi:hypothetical protein
VGLGVAQVDELDRVGLLLQLPQQLLPQRRALLGGRGLGAA